MAEFIVYGNEDWVSSVIISELVRCKDCKYWMADYNHICTAASGYTIKSGDGFCDWAERREDEN